jgi:transcriptional regulator with XRE-family HTH domain
MQTLDDTSATLRHAGAMLRDWRLRRHLSQHELATSLGLSTRALGGLETGRSLPDRTVVLRLAERLEVPLRDRNAILIAAGYDAAFPKRVLGDPVLTDIWATIERAVNGHAPNPALTLDRRWAIVTANDPLRTLIAGVDPGLLSAPVNWARVTLHPAGLAPRIANLRDWRDHIVHRLQQQFDAAGDAAVADLLEEICDYPNPPPSDPSRSPDPVAVPLSLMTVDGLLRFHGATSVFKSATDVTLAELTIETFYPADADTASLMARPTASG